MSPHLPLLAAAGVVALALTTTACGSSSTPASGPSSSSPHALSGSITVYAAASLTGAFTALGTQFQAMHPGTTVRFSFGASSTLAQQILAGAPVDVFASAATKNMTQVAADVQSPTNFVSNTAEIAVAPARAGEVRSIQDLARSGVTLATCQVQVPCGALAKTVLGKAGVTVTPKTQGLDVKSTLAYVTDGQVDAAIVYVTDVRAAGSRVTAVPIPAADNASTEYPIAVTRASRNAAVASAFEQFVLSAGGRQVLTEAGFSAP